jgi:Uma2 family endonuclease
MTTAAPDAPPRPPAGPEPVAEDDGGAIRTPPTAFTWHGFREWACSDSFPERGNIAFLGGELYIDMSPERLSSHGALKTELARVLSGLVREAAAGHLFLSKTLVSHEAAGVSNEPDLVFVSHAAVAAGRVTLVPTADGEDVREMVGSPDLVVEIVSPSSVRKDTRELRARYHAAGIPEYWLIDARREELAFDLFRHAPDGYRPAEPRDGWRASAVFGREVRLDRARDVRGFWQYTLHTRPLGGN